MGLGSFFSGMFARKRAPAADLYAIRMESLQGNMIDFSQYRGKNLLIVNTASKCGYTGQYKELQQLHEQYHDKVTLLAFPANNFWWQEPGSNEDIASFCETNFGVTFQMFKKISVKGNDKHPLYGWLERQSGQLPTWNFCKYAIDAGGKVVGFFGPKVSPLDKKIIDLVAP